MTIYWLIPEACCAISTCGLIRAMSQSTSPDRTSPLMMPPSGHSTATSGRNVERALVHARRCAPKLRCLRVETTTRGATSQRDRQQTRIELIGRSAAHGRADRNILETGPQPGRRRAVHQPRGDQADRASAKIRAGGYANIPPTARLFQVKCSAGPRTTRVEAACKAGGYLARVDVASQTVVMDVGP